MRTFPLVATIAVATFLGASARAECALSDMKLPGDVTVAKPIGSSLDHWATAQIGEWVDHRDSTKTVCNIFVVERFSADGKAHVVYGWPYVKGYGPAGYEEHDVTLTVGQVKFTTDAGSEVEYHFNADGTLAGAYRGGNKGVFKPVEIPKR